MPKGNDQLLTFGGFLVMLEVYNLGGEATRAELMRRIIPRISGAFNKALDSAISSEVVAVRSGQLNIALNKLDSTSSLPPKTYILTKLSIAKLDSAKLDIAKLDIAKLDIAKLDSAKLDIAKLDSAKLDSAKLDIAKLDSARHISAKATDRRNFSAPYQAVVAGKKARRDPVQRFIAKQNPHHRAALWRNFESLDAEARDSVTRRAARFTR